MERAKNKVISGDYQGKLVGSSLGNAFISFAFTKFLNLDGTTVENVVSLDDDSQISFASAAMRGLAGEMLLGPVGLVAAATAKRNGVHIVGIKFKDGKRSVLEVDDKIYKAILSKCF